jgi:hypothetical protein
MKNKEGARYKHLGLLMCRVDRNSHPIHEAIVNGPEYPHQGCCLVCRLAAPTVHHYALILGPPSPYTMKPTLHIRVRHRLGAGPAEGQAVDTTAKGPGRLPPC